MCIRIFESFFERYVLVNNIKSIILYEIKIQF